jgi:endonuclease/exonuclease/phosphatase family metal-dependent hydrolase
MPSIDSNNLRNLVKKGNVITSENDNLSIALADIVPDRYKDTDRFINIVQWNMEWFGAIQSIEKDKKRFGLVVNILEALNADLFIFQEIAGPSTDGRYPGALDKIAEELTRRGAGSYVVYYTEAGGEQRVAMMWDQQWIRAKIKVEQLFPQGTYKTSGGKDAFAQRTPLHGFFSARFLGGGFDKFDFQALGVHLKAMKEGHAQRLRSAEVLADWMINKAPELTNNVLIMGDWNAPPDDPCWAPFHALDNGPNAKVAFRSINDPGDFSYLWLNNQSDQYVSRIDLSAISLASMEQVDKGVVGDAIQWKPIEDVLSEAGGNIFNNRVKTVMSQLKDTLSDHMPTVNRFYIKPPEE